MNVIVSLVKPSAVSQTKTQQRNQMSLKQISGLKVQRREISFGTLKLGCWVVSLPHASQAVL
jgi:hypothetical protein